MDPLANEQLEAELLGQIMLDNRLFEFVADHLDSTAFAINAHARIYSTIASEIQQDNLANPVTLKPYFENDDDIKSLGGISYLINLTGMASITPVNEMAKQLASLAHRRLMRDGLKDAGAACEDMETPLSDIMDRADIALSEQSRQSIHQPSGAECIDELLEVVSSRNAGVTCGQIPGLDGLLGPIKPKQFVVLAARPGMGKTAVALSYSLGAAQKGHGTLFISLEMSSPELGGRMVADLCFDQDVDLPYNAIRDGNLNATQRDWIGKARDFLSEIPFRVVDTGSLTMARLGMLVRSHSRKMAAQGQKLELVVVDYLQLMQGERRASAYERISEISMGLKALAKDTGVGIMALAQLSRAVEQRDDKRPQLSDLRDSGQIEQDADAVLFLLRDEYYLRQSELEPSHKDYNDWQIALAEAQGKIEFILAKRRNGRTGHAMGAFHGAYQAVRGLA